MSSLPRPPKWGVRPEDNDQSAHDHYGEEEAARYTETGQANNIQAELAMRAVQCLGLPKGAPCLLADLGCGSGLSTSALLCVDGSRHAVVGLDAAGGMLELAAREPTLQGSLARSDFGQGLPLRPSALQGAISVSALQWLFAAGDPDRAVRRFFADLHAALEPGARAAFQLYLPGDGESRALLQAATRAGLRTAYFVDFPHPTPAKKYFLCVIRDRCAQHVSTTQPPTRCCPLAWPHTATCTLSWAAGLGTAPALDRACARLQAEHARHAAHALRMLRRAARAFLAACGVDLDAGMGTAGATRSVHLTCSGARAIVPCGAPLHAWCSAAAGADRLCVGGAGGDETDPEAGADADRLGVPRSEWEPWPGPAPPPCPPYLASLQHALDDTRAWAQALRPDPWLWLQPVTHEGSLAAHAAVLHAAKQAPLVVCVTGAGAAPSGRVRRACAVLGAAVVGAEAEEGRGGTRVAWLVHVPALSGEEAARAWQRAWFL